MGEKNRVRDSVTSGAAVGVVSAGLSFRDMMALKGIGKGATAVTASEGGSPKKAAPSDDVWAGDWGEGEDTHTSREARERDREEKRERAHKAKAKTPQALSSGSMHLTSTPATPSSTVSMSFGKVVKRKTKRKGAFGM
ncbi:hypothetical protein KIPB_009332 [Kipferlia bialata]|uniref:Uncharacterized protein n=1 Tax=Kipferlia bialata TaxID=797122 RepID=A0A9K3D305_9EUKA|nr:hypothetical protein KIPB_009332 [Kipferlia bialata]|eukprot:g9332.t1